MKFLKFLPCPQNSVYFILITGLFFSIIHIVFGYYLLSIPAIYILWEYGIIMAKRVELAEMCVVNEEYWKEDLRDKEVHFKVKLLGVFERALPELTDEFVKGLGKFENLENFRTNVRSGLTQEKEHKERERLRLKIMEEMLL